MYHESWCRNWKWRVFKWSEVITFRLSSRRFQSCSAFLLLSSYFLYLSKRFPSKNWHRERIVGWVGKYSILSIQFSRKMTQPPSRRPFSQILSLELEYATRAGVTKEKNKFDQSEGGSYRFGYGFRKRRRILFLRKPDKGPFTRIFSHTRRLHLIRTSSYASRDENITNGLPYHPYPSIPLQKFFFVN